MDRKEAIRILMHLDKYVEHDEDFGIMVRSPLMDATLLAIKALEADAVEVVRCKDCQSGYKTCSEYKGVGVCLKFAIDIKPNDFCSYGERRASNGKE